MNTKILLSLSSAILLASSLLATEVKQPPMQNQDMPVKSSSQKMMTKRPDKGHNPVIGAIMQLKLTPEQRVKIKDIMKQNAKNMPKLSDAFSETSFDKETYVKVAQQREQDKIQNRANLIESVYNVLNDAQKKELKVMLDKKMSMPRGDKMQKRVNKPDMDK
jgi:Spy/CpxP family protein refolding chaperone